MSTPKKSSTSRPGRKATTRRTATPESEIGLRYTGGYVLHAQVQELGCIAGSEFARALGGTYRLLSKYSDFLREATFRFPESK